MTFFDVPLYLVRLAFYWLRLILFYLYHVLLAISKPGSVMIHAALLIGLCWWQYDLIRSSFVFDWWLGVVMHYAPHARIDEDSWYIGLFVAITVFMHYALVGGKTKILGSIVGVFPQIRRPLPPALPLRIKEHKIVPASVALAVPKLKRSRRLRREPNFTANLSDPLLKLLDPPQKPVEPQEAPKPQKEAATPSAPPQEATEAPELKASPASPPAPPVAEGAAPAPQAPAKAVAKARPKRKPSPPPLPPKAKLAG